MDSWSGGGWMVAGLATAVAFSGCTGGAPSDRQMQRQAARTTAEVRQEAKQAVAATKVAAARAERRIDDVAAGVQQGLHENAPPATAKIDINRASQARLTTLPGISPAKAGEIVDGRPYGSPRQLVARGLLTREQYAQVADRLTAGSPDDNRASE